MEQSVLIGLDDSPSQAVDLWLADFDTAVSGPDPSALESLFLRDSHWRDLLAFTWHVRTVSGLTNIVEALRPLRCSDFGVLSPR